MYITNDKPYMLFENIIMILFIWEKNNQSKLLNILMKFIRKKNNYLLLFNIYVHLMNVEKSIE